MGEERESDSLNSWELSGLNSLDLWDYTVELECLQGTEGWNFYVNQGREQLTDGFTCEIIIPQKSFYDEFELQDKHAGLNSWL